MQTTAKRGARRRQVVAALCTVGVVAAYAQYRGHVTNRNDTHSNYLHWVKNLRRIETPFARAVARMQCDPLYRQARERCSRHDFLAAAARLKTLEGRSDLNADEREFVDRQRVICLQDADNLAAVKLLARHHSHRVASAWRPMPHATPRPPVATTDRPVASAQTGRPEQADCGPRALLLVCRRLGIKTDLALLRRKAGTTGKGTSMAGLVTAAQTLGLKAEGVQVSREALHEVQTPALAFVNGNHFEAVLAVNGNGPEGTATVHDPNQPKEETMSQERLLRLSSGYLLLVHR